MATTARNSLNGFVVFASTPGADYLAGTHVQSISFLSNLLRSRLSALNVLLLISVIYASSVVTLLICNIICNIIPIFKAKFYDIRNDQGSMETFPEIASLLHHGSPLCHYSRLPVGH